MTNHRRGSVSSVMRIWRVGVPVALTMAVAMPLAAQQGAEGAAAPTTRPGWPSRLSVVAAYGQLQSSGGGDWYALLDRALQPGSGALDPRVLTGALHYSVHERWDVVAGYEAGGRTASSTSVAHPTGSANGVQQQTRLSLLGATWAGVEWRAWRWRRGASVDRLQLALGAGGGWTRYTLRQWGDFVDATRGVAYGDDFRSAGRGTMGYVGAAVEAPVLSWTSLRLEARRQWASAPMTADYATFDRLDLGGTRLSLGLRLHRPRGAP